MFKLNSLSKRSYSFVFFVLSAGYILLTIIPAPDPGTLANYDLSPQKYRWLVLPIVLFLIIIWSAGFFGSLRVKSYARMIRRSADGRGFNMLSNGILVLAITQPLMFDLNAVVHLIGRYHPATRESLTIINNYVDVLLMGAAMLLIGIGAETLVKLVKTGGKLATERSWVLLFIIFSSIYGYFLVSEPTAGDPNRRVYYLPHWLLLVSVVVPYLFFWYLGLRGSQQLLQYQNKVRGRLYKHALRYLSAGIATVVISSVLTRTLSTASPKLSHLNLTPLLLIIYGLLVVIAAGYVLIALGSNRLKKIEEA
ncbi:MAG TPA: hypothetical protein VG964_03340 [Candidatus Saccharimonadales bacterium]|nr:hypothetical protein [Candidatus Saccharimonadales bacterium]